MSTKETAQLRQALEDTIQVLERTRHSFKSKELGQLRRRLLDLLEQLESAETAQRQQMERRR
ncbi:MAG: hypothetical protein ACK5NQ_11815 [Pseudomonas sp.]